MSSAVDFALLEISVERIASSEGRVVEAGRRAVRPVCGRGAVRGREEER